MSESRLGRIDPDFVPTPHDPEPMAGGAGQGGRIGRFGTGVLTAVGDSDFGGRNREPLDLLEGGLLNPDVRAIVLGNLWEVGDQDAVVFQVLVENLLKGSELIPHGNDFIKTAGVNALKEGIVPELILPVSTLGIVLTPDKQRVVHSSHIFTKGPHLREIEGNLWALKSRWMQEQAHGFRDSIWDSGNGWLQAIIDTYDNPIPPLLS